MKEEYNRDVNPYPSFGKKYNGEKAIISLTSWKARINTVSKTLFSLLKQCPGFHIVLVLSEEEFPKMCEELPENLMLFVENEMIELMFVYKNYKSFKKVLFTMDKYRDVPVISADDDCIYTCNYAQILYKKWEKNKNCVITNDGRKRWDVQWVKGPNTLYPPNTFFFNVLRTCDLIIKYKIFDEDLFYGCWLKMNNIKIIDFGKKPYYVFHDEIEAYSANHKKAVYKDYTQISKFLKENYKQMIKSDS